MKRSENSERLRQILTSALARKAVFPIEIASVLPCLFEGIERRRALYARIREAGIFSVRSLSGEKNGTLGAGVVGSQKVPSLVDAVCQTEPTDDEIERVEEYLTSYRPKEFAPSGEPIFRDWGVGVMADAAQLDGVPGRGTAVGGVTYVPGELFSLQSEQVKLLHRLMSALGELTLFANTVISHDEPGAQLMGHQKTIESVWAAMQDLGQESRDPKTHDVLTVLWLLDHVVRGERWGDPKNQRAPEALLDDLRLEVAESQERAAIVEQLNEGLVIKALVCWQKNHGKWEATAQLLADAGLSEASAESLRTTWSKSDRRYRPTS